MILRTRRNIILYSSCCMYYKTSRRTILIVSIYLFVNKQSKNNWTYSPVVSVYCPVGLSSEVEMPFRKNSEVCVKYAQSGV